ncbi:MAG: hypothetical protein NTV51_18920 [Verrucomicrobia bacterium]|nr:hypothetical protein [Verrucomicrobiota bacterium]
MSRIRFLRKWAGALLAGAALAGCRHAVAPGAAVPAEGRSSFEFVTPPPAPEAKEAKIAAVEPLAKDEWVPPRALETLARPVYPADALAAKEGPVTVGVRIVVGVEGRVTEVGQSLLTFSTPTRFDAEFRAAVEAAVAQWKFRPAEVRHFTTVTNKEGTYRSMTGSEKTEWALHVAFAFNATGGVETTTVRTGAK